MDWGPGGRGPRGKRLRGTSRLSGRPAIHRNSMRSCRDLAVALGRRLGGLVAAPWTLYARKLSLHPRAWKADVALLLILMTGVIFHFTEVLFRPRLGRFR